MSAIQNLFFLPIEQFLIINKIEIHIHSSVNETTILPFPLKISKYSTINHSVYEFCRSIAKKNKINKIKYNYTKAAFEENSYP